MGGQERFNVSHYKAEIRPFLSEYKSSIIAYASGVVGTLLWILSAIFGQTIIAGLAVAAYVLPLLAFYLAYGPFGIEVGLTPMTTGDGGKVPDKVAESRGEVILRDGECEIQGAIAISEKLDSFDIQFHAPDDVIVELQDIPCAEHTYDPESGTLSASSVTVRRFSIVLFVYLVGEVDGTTHEFPLKIKDAKNNWTIKSVDIITR
ncbi:hypothetical protein [Halomarina oriensis]|uniref:Uncharacterized protein n=1 Tax=Halomarina oriensis TaxID=671145 RepID=A0A6B0GLM9_9EURY|nr:hypothetical protein [Halomarina oriensis]MWG34617.1 hypothetical protein [Halomarina oriensis]